jgi:PAS domain-containing protein
VLDDEGRLAYATPRAATLLGRDPWDLVGARMHDLVPERLRPVLAERWQEFLGSGEVRGETALLRATGGEMLIHYLGRADTPVPGRHAVLLVPRNEPPPDQAAFDAAVRDAFPARDGDAE